MLAILLIGHMLGLVLGLGGALGARLVSGYGRKHPEASLFPLVQQFARLNALGLVLLLVTGLGLSQLVAADFSLLTYQIKLGLVLLLVALSGLIHRNLALFKRHRDPGYLKHNPSLQLVAMLVTLLIVVFATLTFY